MLARKADCELREQQSILHARVMARAADLKGEVALPLGEPGEPRAQ